jgi:hypothetical protein
LLPLRAVILLLAVSPGALACLSIGALSPSYRVGLMLAVMMLGLTFATPTREGLWIGTWWLYRLAHRVMPTAVIGEVNHRARIRKVAGGLHVTEMKQAIACPRRLRALRFLTQIPSYSTVQPGVVRLTPGGARAILLIDGPLGPTGGDRYAQWCSQLVNWLSTVDCPAQVLTVISHFDAQKAQAAFARRTKGWPRTRLAEFERDLAGTVAEQSLGLRHYVVFLPGAAGRDGIPSLSRLTRMRHALEATDDEALRALESAMRLASGAGLSVSIPDRDDLAQLLSQTVVGSPAAAVGRDGVVSLGQLYQAVLAIVQLPTVISSGCIVDALTHSRALGLASLHMLPVDPAVARKLLDRRAAMQAYTAREGNDGVDNQVAMSDTMNMLAAIARRDLRPCRIALTIALSHASREGVLDAAERLSGQLHGQGLGVVMVTSPGLLHALAVVPGGVPLGRGLQLTSEDVAACLVPALGTPFADNGEPLVGISELTGAPVYMSVWPRPNHNAIIVGSSGAGKSVAAKALLIRHVMSGASAVVIDPDSEYRKVMNAVGGTYFELGEAALNPLAPGVGVPPDIAAGLVLPVLSVMAGDEKGVRDGRPIRRLSDEDQGWLYGEVAAFFRKWGEARQGHEPVIGDLVQFVQTESVASALTPREVERGRIITARLRRYMQGDRARVFDRPSTFAVNDQPVAIGLRVFAMTYAADLTPALAVVLTSVLAAIGRQSQRMIIVVDEAHRVTVDPDAGEVLGQLVRQARKYGCGVWMCSQRVEDFIGTDLGRTLAATASTKLILGAEEAAVGDLRDVFSLREEEVAAITPAVQGRGVLLSGHERTVVRVVPGTAILALADTTPEPRQNRSDERARL